MLDIKKEFNVFIENHPSFARDIESYKEGPNDSLEFKMKDGKTAWYYPVERNSNYIVNKDEEF